MADGDASDITHSLLKYAGLLLKKGMQEEAAEQLEQLLRNAPDCAQAHYTLAVVRASQDSAQVAAGHFQQALRLAPDDVKALSGMGVVLQQLGRFSDAALCYRKAIRIDPGYQDARINLATLFQEHGMLADAETLLAEGFKLQPYSVRLAYNLANVRHFQGRSLEAVEAYRETLRLAPEHLEAGQNLLFAMHYSARFSDRQIFAEHLRAARKPTFRPPPATPCGKDGTRAAADRRVRLGYVSPDFRDHSVAHFIEPILINHDKSRFEVFCYSNVARPDETTRRIQGETEQWRDIRGMSDEQAASLIARDGIDILIDLAGHTSGNRLTLFARRPAPLQVTWIGYPDTTGLPQMDYRITDWLADPPGRERFHSERLIRLLSVFCSYLPPQSPDVSPLPFDSTGRITFGSFNNLAKVTPEMIRLWGRVLQAVPGSRLLLKARPFIDQHVCARIASAFADAGVDPGRVELHGGHSSTAEHLAEYGRVDIALDTFPYNGTTTTCEALWMGVPVVTLAGTRHASRTGVSILTSCGLDNLIANDQEEYLSVCCTLAKDTGRLASLRQGLRERVLHSALADGEGVTRELETAFSDLLFSP